MAGETVTTNKDTISVKNGVPFAIQGRATEAADANNIKSVMAFDKNGAVIPGAKLLRIRRRKIDKKIVTYRWSIYFPKGTVGDVIFWACSDFSATMKINGSTSKKVTIAAREESAPEEAQKIREAKEFLAKLKSRTKFGAPPTISFPTDDPHHCYDGEDGPDGDFFACGSTDSGAFIQHAFIVTTQGIKIDGIFDANDGSFWAVDFPALTKDYSDVTLYVEDTNHNVATLDLILD